ncbi:hypothetical protein AHAS_Ahas20G0043800 [Arachis hypogaea]
MFLFYLTLTYPPPRITHTDLSLTVRPSPPPHRDPLLFYQRVAGTNSVPASLSTLHHRRYNLLVSEEGSLHCRLYSLHHLQHLHHTLLFRINPHCGLHYPWPSLRINLHLQYLRHHPLHLPTHLRHLH